MLGQIRIGLIQRYCVIFCLIAIGQPSLAASIPTPNLQRNLNIAQHYDNALQGEQVIELTNTTERFIALYLQQTNSEPQGGLLMLHDLAQTPDWPYLLQQPRRYLPHVGWSTLAIGLPTPQRDSPGFLPPTEGAAINLDPESEDAWQTRVMARIASGIKHLNDQGIFNIAIIGYGDGAYWGSRFLAERLNADEEEGYALIMVDAALNYPELADNLAKLMIPILDLYMNDTDYAQLQAQQRKAAVTRADHPDYLQIHDALRHGFYGARDMERTTRRIWGWLRSHAGGYEANLMNKPTF